MKASSNQSILRFTFTVPPGLSISVFTITSSLLKFANAANNHTLVGGANLHCGVLVADFLARLNKSTLEQICRGLNVVRPLRSGSGPLLPPSLLRNGGNRSTSRRRDQRRGRSARTSSPFSAAGTRLGHLLPLSPHERPRPVRPLASSSSVPRWMMSFKRAAASVFRERGNRVGFDERQEALSRLASCPCSSRLELNHEIISHGSSAASSRCSPTCAANGRIRVVLPV